MTIRRFRLPLLAAAVAFGALAIAPAAVARDRDDHHGRHERGHDPHHRYGHHGHDRHHGYGHHGHDRHHGYGHQGHDRHHGYGHHGHGPGWRAGPRWGWGGPVHLPPPRPWWGPPVAAAPRYLPPPPPSPFHGGGYWPGAATRPTPWTGGPAGISITLGG